MDLDRLEALLARIADDEAEVRRTGGDVDRERLTARLATQFLRDHGPALLQLARAVADAPVVRVPKAVEGRLLLIPLSHDFGGQRVRLVPDPTPEAKEAK